VHVYQTRWPLLTRLKHKHHKEGEERVLPVLVQTPQKHAEEL
jgi:hypothetical protein